MDFASTAVFRKRQRLRPIRIPRHHVSDRLNNDGSLCDWVDGLPSDVSCIRRDKYCPDNGDRISFVPKSLLKISKTLFLGYLFGLCRDAWRGSPGWEIAICVFVKIGSWSNTGWQGDILLPGSVIAGDLEAADAVALLCRNEISLTYQCVVLLKQNWVAYKKETLTKTTESIKH